MVRNFDKMLCRRIQFTGGIPPFNSKCSNITCIHFNFKQRMKFPLFIRCTDANKSN